MDEKSSEQNSSENEKSSDLDSSLPRVIHLIKELEYELYDYISNVQGLWSLLSELQGMKSALVSLICCFLIANSFGGDDQLPSSMQTQFNQMANQLVGVGMDVKYSLKSPIDEDDRETDQDSSATLGDIFSSIKRYFSNLRIVPIESREKDVLNGNSNDQPNRQRKIQSSEEESKVSALFPISHFSLTFQDKSIERKFVQERKKSDIMTRTTLLVMLMAFILIGGILSFDPIEIVCDVILCVGMVFWIFYFHNSDFAKENIQDFDNLGGALLGVSFVTSGVSLMIYDTQDGCGSDSKLCSDLTNHSIPLLPLLKLSLLPFFLSRSSLNLKIVIQSLYFIFLIVSFDFHQALSTNSTVSIILLAFLLPLLLL